MADEKDRFGEKIRDSEKAREDQWARQRDAELLEKIRQKGLTAMHCPRCGKGLVDKVQDGVHILACPQNEGAWIEASALEGLLKK
jgi:uncharacterized OB-fold protein